MINALKQRITVPKRSDLPKLPQPKNGLEPLTVDISYVGPETAKTRLGSIPEDYTSYSSGWYDDKTYAKGAPKEDSNDRGESTSIWRHQPVYHADGEVKMANLSETIEAKPYSKTGKSLSYGAVGAILGGLVGAGVGLIFGVPAIGAGVGASIGGAVFGKVGHQVATDDRVRLDWQLTPVKEYELVGYTYDRDENEDDEGDTEDYDHEFDPKIRYKEVDHYFKPVVVHYDVNDPTKGAGKKA